MSNKPFWSKPDKRQEGIHDKETQQYDFNDCMKLHYKSAKLMLFSPKFKYN